MDLKTSKYLQDPTPFFHSHQGVGMRKENPFVNGFPIARKDGAPPGRPAFSFGPRKNFPSKWDDAEKWVINGHESPAHGVVKSADFMSKQQEKKNYKAEDEKMVTKAFNGVSVSESSDDVLKDKFTNEVEPIFPKHKCFESMIQGFAFQNPIENSIINTTTKEVVNVTKNRDMGTEMTPMGSTTTSRCPTPTKSLSPPRHNTPLAVMDHTNSVDIDKLQIQPWTPFDSITSNWISKDEEEEEISKSLRHFEANNECLEGISGPRPSAWEEKETSQPCLRYQIEEARIQAWVNHEKAKADAQSKKLEMKIQKMRSKYEEKLMRKMTVVHRKAEELRAATRVKHSTMAAKSNKTVVSRHPSVNFSGHHGSCGCLIGK